MVGEDRAFRGGNISHGQQQHRQRRIGDPSRESRARPIEGNIISKGGGDVGGYRTLIAINYGGGNNV